jgi:glycerol kinase
MGTKTERWGAAIHLKFSTLQACTGLSWVLHNLPEVQQVLKEGNLLWGTVDTWLLWNLTGGLYFFSFFLFFLLQFLFVITQNVG